MSEQKQTIEDFREAFYTARDRGAHQPGGEFDAKRLALFKAALEWSDAIDRQGAAELLRETIQWSGLPGKKERKQEFKSWLATLERE